MYKQWVWLVWIVLFCGIGIDEITAQAVLNARTKFIPHPFPEEWGIGHNQEFVYHAFQYSLDEEITEGYKVEYSYINIVATHVPNAAGSWSLSISIEDLFTITAGTPDPPNPPTYVQALDRQDIPSALRQAFFEKKGIVLSPSATVTVDGENW